MTWRAGDSEEPHPCQPVTVEPTPLKETLHNKPAHPKLSSHTRGPNLFRSFNLNQVLYYTSNMPFTIAPFPDPDIDTDVDGPSDEQSITRSVISRKKAQNASKTKNQPWKTTHVVMPEDLPASKYNLHDQPWFNQDEYPADDTSYAA